MKIENCSSKLLKERIEDEFPNCIEKQKYETYLNKYKNTINFCNIYLKILKGMYDKNNFENGSLNIAPAYFTAIHKSLSFSLITNLIALFDEKENKSLPNFFDFLDNNKDKIFTRIFYETRECDDGSIFEEKVIFHTSYDENIKKSKEIYNQIKSNVEKLKEEKKKLNYYIDKNSLDIKEMEETIININYKDYENILKKFSNAIHLINQNYDRVGFVEKYFNQDDYKNIIQSIILYSEYYDLVKCDSVEDLD